MPLKHRTKNVA